MEDSYAAVMEAIDEELGEERFTEYERCRCGGEWHGLPQPDCPGALAHGPHRVVSWKFALARLAHEASVDWLGATDPHECPQNHMPVAAHTTYNGIPVCVHVGERGMCAYVRVPDELAKTDPDSAGVDRVTWQDNGVWGIDTCGAFDYWPKEQLHAFGVLRHDELLEMLVGREEASALNPLLDMLSPMSGEPWTLEAMLGRALMLAGQVSSAANWIRSGGDIDDEPAELDEQ